MGDGGEAEGIDLAEEGAIEGVSGSGRIDGVDFDGIGVEEVIAYIGVGTVSAIGDKDELVGSAIGL